MLTTVVAVVREGKIQPVEPLELAEGTRILLTVLPDEDASFWLNASESTLSDIWDNKEDDVYAELL